MAEEAGQQDRQAREEHHDSENFFHSPQHTEMSPIVECGFAATCCWRRIVRSKKSRVLHIETDGLESFMVRRERRTTSTATAGFDRPSRSRASKRRYFSVKMQLDGWALCGIASVTCLVDGARRAAYDAPSVEVLA